MYGDTPPVVLAIDEHLLMRHSDALARAVQRHMLRHPTWIVGASLGNLMASLDRLGIRLPALEVVPGQTLPRTGGALVPGDVMDACDIADMLGSKNLEVWVEGGEVIDGLDLPVLVRAHDSGIRLKVAAPLAGEAES